MINFVCSSKYLRQFSSTSLHKKLKDAVSRARVRKVRFHNRIQSFEVCTEMLVFHHTFSSFHQIDVATKCVDFTVVSQNSKRLSSFPGWECVCAEPVGVIKRVEMKLNYELVHHVCKFNKLFSKANELKLLFHVKLSLLK